MKYQKGLYFWALIRIALGLIFLWAFFDKVFGLGFSTSPDQAWLAGVSPTVGFLKFGTSGPLAGFYQALAGNVVVDWLFMVGLLLIGLALLLGIGLRIAGYSGAFLLLMMWSAVLPPEHHPFLDEHVVYAIAMVAIANVDAGHPWGFGRWWRGTGLVKKLPFLT